ncbi:MAG TPA: glycine oxidase ThiO [Propionibacteriaceae bacterium]|nr:glycine oxidase ThiO [Propionibacteriaceae bacterium]
MSSAGNSATADVVIIGGGLIGTSISWRLRQAGLEVAVIVGERSAAASGVAAGMLAPVTETTFTEQRLLDLNLASLSRYADFVAELEMASDMQTGLRRTPNLSVAYDADDAARLATFADFLARAGHPAERLTGRQSRRHEPLLAPTIRSGLLVEGDWSCDNRLLWRALIKAAHRMGVRELPGFVHRVSSSSGVVTGVELADGSRIGAGWVVLANGAWAGQIDGLPDLPVRPVKGQIVRLDPGRLPGPSLTIRAYVRGAEIYLVPRESGREVVLGATVEELGFDHRVTAGAVYELLRDGRTVMPMSAEYALAETSVGWRPGTPDNAPILGRCDVEGVVLATGHYRNGVLLTPITADVITTLIMSGELDSLAAPFTLDRFAFSGSRAR